VIRANLRSLLGAAVGLCAVAALTAVIASGPGGSSGPSASVLTPAAAPARTGDVTYPQEILAPFLAQEKEHAQADGRVRIQDDQGPAYYASPEALALMSVSYHARQTGLPYNESDLLAPLTDESGTVVAYEAVNVGRLIKPDEIAAPGFDLCRLQIDGLAAAERNAVETGASDASQGASAPIACTPKS
jgi:hypothetical protein